MHQITQKLVEEKLIALRNQFVMLDSDVAILYGVDTRHINKAVTNNPEKFPDGYIFHLQDIEKQYVVQNLHHLENIKFSTQMPRAFTEKGLYMLATILKSKQATATTLAIVETYAQFRELARTVKELSQLPKKQQQKKLMQKSGEIISDLLGDSLDVSDTETTFELNLAVLKFKHTTKRKK